MAYSEQISPVFYKFWVQLVVCIITPLFFFFFSAIYTPFHIREFLETGQSDSMFAFNVIILTCIIFLVLLISRMSLFLLRKHIRLNDLTYFIWCFVEMIVIGQFMTLYLTLMKSGDLTYFNALAVSMEYSMGILIYPYLILTLCFSLIGRNEESLSPSDQLMRFCDENKRIRLVIASSAVLYIEAQENYVHIYYLDGTSIKDYTLRTSMRAIEDFVGRYGIVRCQRSYFVNPVHISVLRKDKEGSISIEFDIKGARNIPVSKKYYEDLTKLI